MDSNKEKQEISVIGRLFSTEALILVMGVVSLGYGIKTAQSINIFFGVAIIGGFFVLRQVRKKDWKKHWEEEEQFRAMRQLKEEEKKERERNDKNKP